MTTATQEAIETHINFLGLEGNPIENLKVRLTVDGKEQHCTTDAQGCIPPLQVEPDTEVEVAVQRMDGNYKTIDTNHTGCINGAWTYTSPNMVFEVTTELHQGEPGHAESLLPTWSEADLGMVEILPSATSAAATASVQLFIN